MCSFGFIGENCEFDINECFFDLCYNGVICVDGKNGYRCICFFVYIGEYCEIEIDFCEFNLCFGELDCVNFVKGFIC